MLQGIKRKGVKKAKRLHRLEEMRGTKSSMPLYSLVMVVV